MWLDFSQKWAKFATSFGRLTTKNFQLQGASAPGPRWGSAPRPPLYRARHMLQPSLSLIYEVLYDTLALVAETGQSQVYIRGNDATSEVHSEVGYELVLGTSWLGYELAWYDFVRVRVDRHPAVRYAALSACRKVHVCHCNSLGGAT